MTNTIQQFDYTADLAAVILWQYNKATNFQSLVYSNQVWFNTYQTQFWIDWYNQVFYLYNPVPDSFSDYGALIWSIILNIPLQLDVQPDEAGKTIFLFDQAYNFDNGVFSYGGHSIALTPAAQLLILKLRYFQLNNRGAIPQINAFMQNVFTGFEGYDGTVYAIDGLNMTMEYIFTRPLPPLLTQILKMFDLLPRPAGVQLTIVVDPGSYFLFDATSGNGQNFDNGPFFGQFI